MSRVAAAPSFDPVADLNITPLIDVLLVLIVMFILCLPIATNELPIDLPRDGGPARTVAVHRLTVDPAGAIAWDGAAIDEGTLAARLRAVAAADEQLAFAPDARARYGRVDALLATVKRAGVTRLGFEGNERFAGL